MGGYLLHDKWTHQIFLIIIFVMILLFGQQPSLIGPITLLYGRGIVAALMPLSVECGFFINQFIR
jgi:hypothetical protein